jgi:hypothetical protein
VDNVLQLLLKQLHNVSAGIKLQLLKPYVANHTGQNACMQVMLSNIPLMLMLCSLYKF